MSATWAKCEGRAADALGVERVKRKRGQRAGDVGLVVLQSGVRLQAEVKSRKARPRWATSILEQAKRYAKSAIPIGVLYELGLASGLVIVDLDAFCLLVGITKDTLPTKPRARKRVERQLEIAGCA